MLFGMAAASSAMDLIKTLTQSGSSSKSASSTTFATGSDVPPPPSSPGVSGASGQSGLIAPNTMNALFAAQGQSDTSSTSRSQALKNLFKTLDADADGTISKSEFESALGAGGTNTANADKVFDKLDADGDGSVSLGELSSALKPKKHAHGPKPGGGEDALMQALDGANSSSVTNADGSTVTMNQPAASSQSSAATRSYNAIEQMIQRQAQMLAQTSASSSISFSA